MTGQSSHDAQGALHPVTGTPTLSQLMDAQTRGTAGKSSLEAVQKNASDWRTGFAGLLTIVTGAFLFKGSTEIRDYPSGTQLILGLLAIGAAAAGVAGLWYLLNAAHGKYKLIRDTDVAKEGGLNNWYMKVAASSLQDLTVGKRYSVASVFLISLLIVSSWYLPTAPSDPPAQVRVTESGVDVPGCGTLKVADSRGVTYQVTGEREPRTVPFDRLVSVVLVPEC